MRIKCCKSYTPYSFTEKCWYGCLRAQVLIQRFGKYFHHQKEFPFLYMTCFQSRKNLNFGIRRTESGVLVLLFRNSVILDELLYPLAA